MRASLFHLLSPELNDCIYECVAEISARNMHASSSIKLDGPAYDSLASFDVYLRDERVLCTRRSNGPYEFQRRFRRMGRTTTTYKGCPEIVRNIRVLRLLPPLLIFDAGGDQDKEAGRYYEAYLRRDPILEKLWKFVVKVMVEFTLSWTS